MQAAPVREGQVLAGKYRVERVLGVGGMGVVVAARHLQLDERVALKFLLGAGLGNADVVARFAREARAAAKIRSEHVARVTDVGTLEDGAPYLVMEYLEGVDLAGVLRERGPLPLDEVSEWVLQACEAVGEAHSIGIVHRDLKPANLFLARRHDGSACVKVLDFGISKLDTPGAADMGMTKTQAMMGSPLYMSPEQMFSAKSADQRSDVWALGVILYELLTGTPPFNGDTIPHLAILIAQEAPPPLGNFRPDLPPELEAVILRCLEKDRGKRYQNVGELAVALAEFAPKRARISAERVSRMMHAAGMAGSALVLPPSSMPETAPVISPPPAITAAAWSETRPGAKPGEASSGARSRRSGIAVAVVALASAGAWFSWRGGSKTPEPTSGVPARVSADVSGASPRVPVPVSAPVAAAAAVSASSITVAPAPSATEAARLVPGPLPSPSKRSTPPGGARAAAVPTHAPAAAPPMAAPAAVASRPSPPATVPARPKGFDFGGRH